MSIYDNQSLYRILTIELSTFKRFGGLADRSVCIHLSDIVPSLTLWKHHNIKINLFRFKRQINRRLEDWLDKVEADGTETSSSENVNYYYCLINNLPSRVSFSLGISLSIGISISRGYLSLESRHLFGDEIFLASWLHVPPTTQF